ncbi:hypothetical protein HPP92_017011 [Vanilla planifolia]|uniref:Uncharacterized protein n=1 Tax=Vanilla planifolia TaxID=51239 RepID=A0A835QG93_VANPL|nr:hypothetical protein HPP92_017011 [Vanilla planifolia]
MNDAYNGMLYDFIGKQCKDAKSETRCSSLSEKHTYDEGQSFSAVHGKMQLCFDTSASDAQTKNEVELATGTSNATSVLRNFSDAHDLNKSTPMTGVLDYSANVADETSWISKHMESETSEHSKQELCTVAEQRSVVNTQLGQFNSNPWWGFLMAKPLKKHNGTRLSMDPPNQEPNMPEMFKQLQYKIDYLAFPDSLELFSLRRQETFGS